MFSSIAILCKKSMKSAIYCVTLNSETQYIAHEVGDYVCETF